jgi:tRNA pseudouridine13 synthase
MRGPARKMAQQGIDVAYLGQVQQPFTSQYIRANRFQITLRALTEAQTACAQSALEEVRADGLPNYFDDQRFGSVSQGQRFVASEIVLGHHEEALKPALAAPYSHDRSAVKKEKALLREHWGDWARCKEVLPRSHARSLVDFLLCHPGDFRGALERLNPDLRGLYLSAYQSHLWNRTLARWIENTFPSEMLCALALRGGKLPFVSGMTGPQRQSVSSLNIALPSPRVTLGEDSVSAALRWVLEEEGITLDALRLRGFKKMFFSRGERAAWCFPQALAYNSGTDELHHARLKLQLNFELPRGSYATLLIKRITAE